ncbi:MAG: glycosyltransferase family 4 protein [FCB group bacterium]|nr:glycosyltransferase family 4 protein [FCB group bacterium]
MNFAGKKMLVVSPDFPYPPNHGGRVDIWNRIRTLHHLGFEIDLIATVKTPPHPDDIRQVKSCVKKVICCPRRNRLIDMCSRLPLQSRSRKKLSNIPCDTDYDLVLLETEYVYSILANKNLRAKSLVLRVQNDEEKYFRELCGSTGLGPRKLYYLLEALRFSHLWRLILRRVPNMMFISSDEFQVAMQKYKNIHGIFLPPAISNGSFVPPLPKARKVLFVGSFFMVNNREGLLWYLQNIHPRLADIDGYEFHAAGNSRGQNLQWLYDQAERYDNIKIYDSPEDIKPLYRDCAVFINPMLHGAGVKLKTIEAIRNGLPVISTTIGNQGTGLIDSRDILVSDVPDNYADHVRAILLNPDKGVELNLSAQRFIADNYDQEKILSEFFENLLRKGIKA